MMTKHLLAAIALFVATPVAAQPDTSIKFKSNFETRCYFKILETSPQVWRIFPCDGYRLEQDRLSSDNSIIIKSVPDRK